MSMNGSIRVIACLVLFAFAPPPGHSRGAEQNWTVNDLTNAIALSAVETQDSFSKLSLMNKSPEVVTAVALLFKAGTHHYEDWLGSESEGLAPGENFEIMVGPDEAADRKIKIVAVLFQDGGGKGDASQIDVMNLHRFGQILEQSRIHDILKSGRDPAGDEGINDIVQKIGHIPRSAGEALESLDSFSVPGISIADLKRTGGNSRDAILWGVSTAREEALREMQAVKELPLSSADKRVPSRAEFLSFMRGTYEKRNQRGTELIRQMKGGR